MTTRVLWQRLARLEADPPLPVLPSTRRLIEERARVTGVSPLAVWRAAVAQSAEDERAMRAAGLDPEDRAAWVAWVAAREGLAVEDVWAMLHELEGGWARHRLGDGAQG
jgi:hypothetical protein